MPMYEYACQSCGARFEVRQKFSDDPLAICPTCGGPIHRVLFPASIVFKGGGFYSTDNRHEGSASATSTAATASGGPKSETKGDIKSETPGKGGSTGSDSKAPASTAKE